MKLLVKDKVCIRGFLLWAFIDNENKMITNSGSLNSANSLTLEVPENASKLIVNCNKTIGHSIYEISYNSIENFDSRITQCENSIISINGEISNLQDEIQNLHGVTTLTNGVTLYPDGRVQPSENPLETLESGFYYTDEYAVYLDREDPELPPSKIIAEDEIFYYNKNDKTFIITGYKYLYTNNQWLWNYTQKIENTILTNNPYAIPTCHAVYEAINNISPSGRSIYHLTGDTVLNANGNITVGGTLTELDSGFYLCDFPIYYHTLDLNNIIYPFYSIVYYDSEEMRFYGTFDSTLYDNNEGDWFLFQNDYITNELVDKRMKIPTSHAVYEALQIKTFDGDIVLKNSTGGAFINNQYITLETGYYLCNHSIYLESLTSNNLLYGYGDIVYIKNIGGCYQIYGSYLSCEYDLDVEREYILSQNSYIDPILINARNKIPTSQAVYNAIENSKSLTTLTQSITLENDGSVTPNLESGFYYTDEYAVYFDDGQSSPQRIISSDELFYYNKTDKSFVINGFIYFYNINHWSWNRTQNIENVNLTDSEISLPTSHAVYTQIKKITDLLNGKNKLRMNTSFAQTISGITISVDTDGTITINGTATATIHPTNLGKIVMEFGKNYTCMFIVESGTMSGGAGFYLSNSPSAYSNNYGGRAIQNNNRDFPLENVTNATGYLYSTINNGASFNNFKIKVQIVEGTVADYNYSEYTGGVVYHKDIESY